MVAAEFNQTIQVFELDNGAGVWRYLPAHSGYTAVGTKESKLIYSPIAGSAPGLQLTLRRQRLSENSALLWNEKQLMVVSIDDRSSRHLLTVTAVSLPLVTVSCSRQRFGRNELNNPIPLPPEELSFPGWLAEKYVRYGSPEPGAGTELSYVLLVPKAVLQLKVGDVITIGADRFAVQLPHLLGEYRNEYEIVLWRDA